jgi:cellulose synthase (UDP-forming)
MPAEQAYLEDFRLIRVFPPNSREVAWKTTLILLGIVFSLDFLIWLTDPRLVGDRLLYTLLLLTFVYFIARIYLEWYFTLRISSPVAPVRTREWKVDVLTTYCEGEPREMVINTLKAIKKLKFPHTAYLCDEEDDVELKEVCRKLGIVHVTRKSKINAKAGNINNALNTVAKGELCLILDPDHVPHPDFLHEVLPYFEDPEIGYVQTVQGYYNQEHTIIARAAAQQSYQFYGPIMMGLNGLGAVPAIGANCVFRRIALDSIGGHAPGTTEDMHTSMLLHAKGWKSVYVPIMGTRGLVPWNFSGYSKQQLKWSRGTFDLLVRVFPGLVRKLSVNQILYYLSAGLFYLYGLKGLLDILIPVLALLMIRVPIKVDILNFFQHFLPLILIVHVIRQFNQRWLFDEQEKGFHLKGGILLKSTWWIALVGFIYTLINRKVPYLPTPKDFRHETPWNLFIPNLLAILLSITAIVYGLKADFNPYSIFMAGIAAWNVVILAFGTIMGMQNQIVGIHKRFQNSFISKGSRTRLYSENLRISFYRRLQHAFLPLFTVTIAAIIVRLSLVEYTNTNRLIGRQPPAKYYGMGFLGRPGSGNPAILDGSPDANKLPDLIYLQAGLKGLSEADLLHEINTIYAAGSIPFLHIRLDVGQDGIDSLQRSQIEGFSGYLKERYLPVFICPMRIDDGVVASEEKYYLILQQLASSFVAYGCGHVTWVWQAVAPADSLYLDSGKEFVSWALLSLGDSVYAQSSGFEGACQSFASRNRMPLVFLGGLPDSGKWSIAALESQFGDVSPSRSYIFWEEGKSTGSAAIRGHRRNPELTYFYESLQTRQAPETASYLNPGVIVRSADGFSLMRKGEAVYVKGIAYNPGHDWQDDRFHLPLTRRKLQADFAAIRAMGGNTIRRYSPGVFDYNIFREAEEQGLHVLYGFWFDPAVDYLMDKKKVEKYRREVIGKVERYKNEPQIIAWSIGNETWGLLKHHFGEPYLTMVRRRYLEFLEGLAKEIHRIDPTRPVMAMEEHSPQLPAAMQAFERFLPSVDVMGVNSYYTQNLGILDSLASAHYREKPYLVSEFGPHGYWYKPYTSYLNDTVVLEPGSYEKAQEYQHNWEQHVIRHRGNNLGGVAFCWQDRFEGTSTWFGLTDIHGLKKPGYQALMNTWTGKRTGYSMPSFIISGPGELHPEDKNYTFRAITRADLDITGFSYKWLIYEDKTFFKVLETEFGSADSVTVKIPRRPSSYRLYVHVSPDNQHVVTVSHPLNILWHE